MTETRSSTVWQKLMMNHRGGDGGEARARVRGRAVGPLRAFASLRPSRGPTPARSGFPSIPTLQRGLEETSTTLRSLQALFSAPAVRSANRFAGSFTPRFDGHRFALDKRPRASRCGPVALRASTVRLSYRADRGARVSKRSRKNCDEGAPRQ